MAEPLRPAALVLRGDARALPLPDASVDLIVTSPPYWGQRAYEDGGEIYEGQIGSEAGPGEWLDSLVDCTREWVRVLKPTGSIFVNCGDKYSDRADGGPSSARSARGDRAEVLPAGRSTTDWAPRKSKLGLPWRYALRVMDELRLILRMDNIWHKVNPLPESAEDRCRTIHEYVFHFTVAERYFAAVDEIREPYTGGTHARRSDGRLSPFEVAVVAAGHRRGYFPLVTEHPLGKRPGSVWSIAAEPFVPPPHLRTRHFAAFPLELPRRAIAGWSPTGWCIGCGEPRRPQARVARIDDRRGRVQGRLGDSLAAEHGPDGRSGERYAAVVQLDGYRCACSDASAPTRPAVVLDPFSGTGTTPLVAKALGRIGIGIDRSADYCRLAAWRTTDPGQLAKAMRVDPPPREVEDQLDLFAREAVFRG